MPFVKWVFDRLDLRNEVGHFDQFRWRVAAGQHQVQLRGLGFYNLDQLVERNQAGRYSCQHLVEHHHVILALVDDRPSNLPAVGGGVVVHRNARVAQLFNGEPAPGHLQIDTRQATQD